MNSAKNKELIVETKNLSYKINFNQIQLEITGRCNMHCQHCRAANELKHDIPISQIRKIMKFASMFRASKNEVVISGGEPLMHNEFPEVLKTIRETGCDVAVITTNGSLVNKKHLSLIRSLSFEKFIFSVSLDSLNPKAHDEFRGYNGAHKKALRAIELKSQGKGSKVYLSLRVTVLPNQINLMDEFSDFAFRSGYDIISFSAVYPIGRAKKQPALWMTSSEKKKFLEKVKQLSTRYHPKDLVVSTNDPLKNAAENCVQASESVKDDKLILNGCIAGAVTFHMCSNGDLTPCALLEMPVMNVLDLTIPQIIERYKKSRVIRNLLESESNLKGKCSTCNIKSFCRGGCRARALGRANDYLAEDPECWM